MRITFVVPVLDVSGGARIIAGHAQRLAAKGHEVLVVAPLPARRRTGLKARARALLRPGASPARPAESHYRLAHVPIRTTGRAGPIEARDVPDADVIVATWWETAEWVWALPEAKGAKVHFIQGYEAFPGQPADRVEAVWRLPICKIAVSQWLVDLGRQRFGIDHMALVPNSIDHHVFTARQRSRGEPPTVGFLFHEAGFKDMPTTFKALERLKQLKPETRLVSFGAYRPDRALLPPDTEFHHLPRQEVIADIYARCDAWLSPSRSEGYNLPALEAMACGCPVVCAKTGRPLEIVEDGANGYLVDQGDVAGFAASLANIVSATDHDWRKMSEAAVRAAAHPTWAESSSRFEEALIRSRDASLATPREQS